MGENDKEYQMEKRSRELLKKGYNADAVAGMMFGERGSETGGKAYIKGLQKKSSCIKLDGNI